MDIININGLSIEGRITEHTLSIAQRQLNIHSIVMRLDGNLTYRLRANDIIEVRPDYESILRETLRGYITTVAYMASGSLDGVFSSVSQQQFTLTISFIEDSLAGTETPEQVAIREAYEEVAVESAETHGPLPEPEQIINSDENIFSPTDNNRLKNIDEFDTIHRDEPKENLDEREDNTI